MELKDEDMRNFVENGFSITYGEKGFNGISVIAFVASLYAILINLGLMSLLTFLCIFIYILYKANIFTNQPENERMPNVFIFHGICLVYSGLLFLYAISKNLIPYYHLEAYSVHICLSALLVLVAAFVLKVFLTIGRVRKAIKKLILKSLSTKGRLVSMER